MMACRLVEGFCDLGWKRVFRNLRPSDNTSNWLKLQLQQGILAQLSIGSEFYLSLIACRVDRLKFCTGTVRPT